jgi:DNA-binding response OmpR family regulator
MSTRPQESLIILAIDRDFGTRAVIHDTLEREGYHLLEAEDAQTALVLAREYRPAVIILDFALRDMSGLDLCTHLRATPFVDQTPILFISEHQNAQYAAEALNRGADDYLRKPFATRELSARVRALLRRAPGGKAQKINTVYIDMDGQNVWINNRIVELTPTEFGLLDYFCQHPNDLHTANDLLEKLWNYPPGGGDTALVRNHIRNLRRKIEANPDYPEIVVSMHGLGYTFNARVIYAVAEQAAGD